MRNLICCILLAFGLSACSAVGVIESSDPKVKLGQAADLLQNQNRPGPAERLISEAYEIYRTRNDEKGMAEASRLYGYFFNTTAVGNWSRIYLQAGFHDGSSFGDRFRSSAAYFSRAANHFVNAGDFASATNALRSMAWSQLRAGEKAKACDGLDQSLELYQQTVKTDPSVKLAASTGYSSYEELIQSEKKQWSCA